MSLFVPHSHTPYQVPSFEGFDPESVTIFSNFPPGRIGSSQFKHCAKGFASTSNVTTEEFTDGACVAPGTPP